MKIILLLLMIITSISSKSHKLLTEVMSETNNFIGFGYISNNINDPSDHVIYQLTKPEINNILNIINAEEAIKQFTAHSNEPSSEAGDYEISMEANEYSEIIEQIPHSDQYWAHPYEFQCEAGVSNCLEGDLTTVGHAGNHGNGIFGPENLEETNVRLVAQRVCSQYTHTNDQLVIPYFLGPSSFSTFQVMSGFPYAITPVLSVDNDIDNLYTMDHGIEFKCVYKLSLPAQ